MCLYQLRNMLGREMNTSTYNCFLGLVLLISCFIVDIKSTPEKDRYVKEGRTAQFSCPGKLTEISWLKGSVFLRDGETRIVNDERFVFTDDGDQQLMAISDTKADDSASFVCKNQFDKVLIRYNLIVLAPPDENISYSGPEVVANETETVNLWCNVSSNPTPVISWLAYFDDDNPTDIGINGPKLQIRNVSRYCPTRFQCLINYDHLEDMTFLKGINVTVQYAPSVSLEVTKHAKDNLNEVVYNQTEQNITIAKFNTVTLRCTIYASPYVISEWFLDNERFYSHKDGASKTEPDHHPITYKIKDSHATGSKNMCVFSITIRFIDGSEYGMYSCKASNNLGKSAASVQINNEN